MDREELVSFENSPEGEQNSNDTISLIKELKSRNKILNEATWLSRNSLLIGTTFIAVFILSLFIMQNFYQDKVGELIQIINNNKEESDNKLILADKKRDNMILALNELKDQLDRLTEEAQNIQSQSRPAPIQDDLKVFGRIPIVYIQRHTSSRSKFSEEMRLKLVETGLIAPNVEAISIEVDQDQIRYFHDIPEVIEVAQEIAKLVGIDPINVTLTKGYSDRVPTSQFEIWLSP